MNRVFGISLLLLVLLIAIVIQRTRREALPNDQRTTHVVLIGASIGQSWDLASWPTRVKLKGFSAESLANWQFDKQDAVSEVVMRPSRKFRPTRTYLKSLFLPPPRKPDIVILKECSSYFPGDLDAYKKEIKNWVSQLQGTGAKIVLATVVPVTESRSRQVAGKQESLSQYNRWVREYAREQGFAVLELDAALQEDEQTGYLMYRFAQQDGTHLNGAAYLVLDEVLKNLLCMQVTPQACSSKQSPAQ